VNFFLKKELALLINKKINIIIIIINIWVIQVVNGLLDFIQTFT